MVGSMSAAAAMTVGQPLSLSRYISRQPLETDYPGMKHGSFIITIQVPGSPGWGFQMTCQVGGACVSGKRSAMTTVCSDHSIRACSTVTYQRKHWALTSSPGFGQMKKAASAGPASSSISQFGYKVTKSVRAPTARELEGSWLNKYRILLEHEYLHEYTGEPSTTLACSLES